MALKFRRQPEHTANVPRVPLSTLILKHHPTNDINMDFMFINGTSYLHTKSTVIKFLSIQQCKGRGKKEMERGIDKVVAKFTQRAFEIVAFNEDNKFETLRANTKVPHLCILSEEASM
jgi:hypothetical protein